MSLNFLPLLTALLPALAINFCYLLAASQGHVPWCIPYLEGCTSISATGRQAPESYLFRALIIPTAVLLVFYWRLSHEWLKALGSETRRVNRAMLVLGTVAALALIVYATVLGSVGEGYKLQRRIGVAVFYLCTMAAQLLITWQVLRAARRPGSDISRRTAAALTALLAVILAAGLIGLVLSGTWEGYGDYDDSVQWSLTLLLLAHVATTYLAWKESGFRARFEVAADRADSY